MKKIVFLFAIAMLVGVSCKDSKPQFELEGTLYFPADDEISADDYEDKYIYLYDTSLTDAPVDSTLVKSGKFSFKGDVSDNKTYSVVSGDFIFIGEFIPENGALVLDFEKSNVATGTPLNDTYSKYVKEREERMEQIAANFSSDYQQSGISDEERNEILMKFQEDMKHNAKPLFYSYFEDNKNNILGAILLVPMAEILTVDEYMKVYNDAGDIVKEYKSNKEALERFEAIKRTTIGASFVDFNGVTSNDGSVISLSKYVGKGNYVVADFWASWCGPCIKEMPVMVEIYKEFKDKGLEIVGIGANDKKEAHIKAVEKNNITWPQILDVNDEGIKAYNVRAIPALILFAPDGTIAAKDITAHQLHEKLKEIYSK